MPFLPHQIGRLHLSDADSIRFLLFAIGCSTAALHVQRFLLSSTVYKQVLDDILLESILSVQTRGLE